MSWRGLDVRQVGLSVPTRWVTSWLIRGADVFKLVPADLTAWGDVIAGVGWGSKVNVPHAIGYVMAWRGLPASRLDRVG